MKRFLTALLCGALLLQPALLRAAPQAGQEETGQEESGQEEAGAGPQVGSPSAFLMEASTGTILYEKDADTARPPASVTKVMTMLLIFDAIESGTIRLEDEVTTSEYAASMGGSQVFLEPGEVQTVETLLKCISVASANDACVAMAEYICGSEEEFVSWMNERAQELGMEIPYRQTEGRRQCILFPGLDDVGVDVREVTLKAVSDCGLPVCYYVKEGPAEVDGNRLRLTPIPPRSKFPVKVTVVAWQYGLPGKVQTAEPVERSFYIFRNEQTNQAD